MERKNRLNHTLDIQRVRRNGKSIAHPFFVLIYCRDKSTDNAPVGGSRYRDYLNIALAMGNLLGSHDAPKTPTQN